MNVKAVLGYQDMLSMRIAQLVNALEKRQGSEVDLASWLSCLSYVSSRPYIAFVFLNFYSMQI